MNKRLFNSKYVIIISVLVLAFVVLTSLILKRSIDEEKKKQIVVDFITTALSSLHYNPIAIDDDLSKKAWALYIKRIDYNKRYFLQSDIRELQKFQNKIDDELIGKQFKFYLKAVEIVKKRIDLTQEFYKDILSKPFDFKMKEEFETEPEKIEFAKNEKALKNYWRKMLKYQVITRLDEMMEMQEQAQARHDSSFKIKTFDQMEVEAREKLLKNYNDAYHRMSKLTDLDQFTIFINSVINVFDPHSDYMPPDDKQNFDIQMSGKLEGIGATLQEANGYIKVVDILPGTPSWLQGELQVNDLILKVGQGDEEPVDIIDMRIDEAVKLIRGKKGTEVRLTVKKVDGTMKVIKIIRDVVIIEETYAKSAMLADNIDTTFKVAYIYLPKFYVDFNDRNGRSCSTDVETEIEKISKENPKGIILDLRNNGGGSLMDVVKMAGLFIKDGPVVQVKSRYGTPTVLRDDDPKIQYKGPLIIMVNEFSASASEIMAAAMQDYKRAVIVGSKSFGKGSVQRIIEIDEHIPSEYEEGKPYGALKITIQKFYRINGGSTQIKGVIPDINLTNIYSYIEVGEKEQDYAMPWTEIAPVNYQYWNSTYHLTTLKSQSDARVKSDSSFIIVEQKAMNNKRMKDETLFSLSIVDYRAKQKKMENDNDIYNTWMKKETGIHTFNLKDDNLQIHDTSTSARNKKWLEELRKDVYLKEAVQIMKGML